MIRISEFQIKDVVSVSSGRRLGHISDLEINVITGKIEAIIVQGNGKMLGLFGRENDIMIPWRDIIKVGSDVILVNYKEQHFDNDLY